MADQGPSETPAGFVESVKRLLATFVAILHNRFELVATEFQEELARLAALLLWALVGVLALAIGLSFVAVAVMLAVAPENRTLAAGILAALFLGAAGWAWLAVRRVLGMKPRAFDASLNELEKDREKLGAAR